MRLSGILALALTAIGLGFCYADEHAPGHTAQTAHESTEIKPEDFTPHPLHEESPEPAHEPAHDSHAAHAHHFHQNHLALFLGVTIHAMHFYPSVGLDYEFLFNEKIGITAVVEQVFAEHSEQITGLGVAIHPFPSWKVAAIPALVLTEGHAAFLMRGTVEYGLHAGPVSYGPSASVDYVHSTVLAVLGLVVGMGF